MNFWLHRPATPTSTVASAVPFQTFLPPIIGILLADTLCKFFAHRWLPADGVPLIPGITLRVFENIRGPFGLLPLWLTMVMSAMVLLAAGSRWTRMHHPNEARLLRRSLSLLVGGGIANVGERLVFGRTTDVVWIGHVTALNVADVAILSGVLGLLTLSWRARSF